MLWVFLRGKKRCLSFLVIILLLAFLGEAERIHAASQTSFQPKTDALFLSLCVEDKVSKKSVKVRGRVGIGGVVFISVNGKDQGTIKLNAENKYSKKIYLDIGDNLVQVTAVRGEQTKTLEKIVKRKAVKAIDKPLRVSFLHSRNETKKDNILVKGVAHGVWTVDVSVNGEFQVTAKVKTRVGKFKARVRLPLFGDNIIEVTARKENTFVKATKRVTRWR